MLRVPLCCRSRRGMASFFDDVLDQGEKKRDAQDGTFYDYMADESEVDIERGPKSALKKQTANPHLQATGKSPGNRNALSDDQSFVHFQEKDFFLDETDRSILSSKMQEKDQSITSSKKTVRFDL